MICLTIKIYIKIDINSLQITILIFIVYIGKSIQMLFVLILTLNLFSINYLKKIGMLDQTYSSENPKVGFTTLYIALLNS